MSGILDLIFGSDEAAPQGPSVIETDAQKEQEAIISAKDRKETSERAARNRVITARASGPQTLFTRPGSIPKPVKLGDTS